MRIFTIILEMITLVAIVAFDGLMFSLGINFWAELLLAMVGTGFGVLLMMVWALDYID